MKSAARRPRPADGEAGFALITAMLMIGVLSILLAAVAQDTIASMALSRHGQDWNAAMGAAEAGASDFTYRVNSQEDYSYCLALEVQSGAKATSGFCSSPAIPSVPPATAPGWVAEPDNTDNILSCYQYSVPAGGVALSSSNTATTAILLDVVGKVTTGSCTNAARAQRSIRVTLTRNTYLNYGYFTDRETQDPVQYSPTLSSEFSGVANAQQYAYQYCSNYYFALSPDNTALLGTGTPAGGVATVQSTDTRTNHSSQTSYTNYTQNNICTYTKFGGGDTFNGPVHTNDIFSFNGSANFQGKVEVGHDSSGSCTPGYTATSANTFGRGVLWLDAQQLVQGSASAPPTFGSTISCRGSITLPTQNSTLLTQAQSSGCAYTGITYIYFHSDGTMDVYSPGTPAGTAGLSGACPVNGTWNPSASSSFNGVIYVQNLSSSTSCTLSTAANAPSTPGAFGNTLGRIIQDQDLNELENEDVPNATPATWGATATNAQAYDCHNGDAFVGGTPSGQLTVGTDNNVEVYQNLIYADSTLQSGSWVINANGSNVVGLEPKGSVQLYHPVSCAGWTTSAVQHGTQPTYASCATAAVTNLLPTPPAGGCTADTACQTNFVQAAVLAFNGEYTAENWAYGPGLGQISTSGSVTQRYRGRMAGTNNGSGYGKTYVYDSRLATITPPFFLPPSIFAWSQSSLAETTADTAH